MNTEQWTLDSGHGSRDKVYRYRDNKNTHPTKTAISQTTKQKHCKCIVCALYRMDVPPCNRTNMNYELLSTMSAAATLHRIFTGYNLKVIKQWCSMCYVSSSPPLPSLSSSSSLALLFFPRTQLALGRCRDIW